MKKHVVILGAGFGGLELSTRLSESLADELHVTLIDRSDSFLFGFSKLDIMFARRTTDELRCYYRDIAKEGVEFRRETVTEIDAANRHVTTDVNSYEADILVVALGADYEPEATPGFVEGGFEYYSVAGAERLSQVLPELRSGTVLIAVLSVPFKCPPAPFEGALLLHDYLTERGVREKVDIRIITPMPVPIPPSPETNQAIIKGLDERNIAYTFGHRVHSIDPASKTAQMADGGVPYEMFIGIPKHRVPDVVEASGLTEGGTDGWVHVDKHNLMTPYEGVYAIGDCADAPVPRAGVFAETAARVVADDIAARLRGDDLDRPYDGKGSCYIEFGGGKVGKVDADFLSGPTPVAPFLGPSLELAGEKEQFAATRRRRWFS